MNSKLRSKLINELVNDEYFTCLSSHKERMSYILEEKLSFQKLSGLLAPTIAASRKKAGKCFIKAKQFSDEADFFANQNKDGQRGQLFLNEALQLYKKAILYTPFQESAFLSQLYLRKFKMHMNAKDSAAARFSALMAVEFFMKKQESAHFLQEEINFAKKWIEEQTDPSGNRSDPYIAYFIDSSCKIECSPVVGRHFVADKAGIAQGQVLLEEYPYCTILMPKYFLLKCSNCHITLEQSFYPCPTCTEVLFCSSSCASQANTDFHSQECGLTDAFNNLKGAQKLPVFRMIAKAGGPLAMIKSKEQFADYSVTDYLTDRGLQFSRPAEKTAVERMATYAMSSRLIDHDEVYSAVENVCHSLQALELATLFELVSGVELSPAVRLHFATLLIGDIRRIGFNAFSWQTRSTEVGQVDNKIDFEHVAQAQCLLASLVNHSCDSNTTWEFTDSGMICFTANREIKPGENIEISYGTSPAEPYHRRQKRLNGYYFACACSACFADVCKYAVLRCDACPAGAVPVQKVIDQVPQLRGTCLRCFKAYPDFDETIKCLRGECKTLIFVKGISFALKLSSTTGQQQLQMNLLHKAVKKMQMIARLSLPSSADVLAAVGNLSTIMQNIGLKTLKEVFSSEKLYQLALLVGGILFHEKETLFKKDKVSKKKVNMQEISSLNFWFDLSTALLDDCELPEQCDDHQKLLFLAVAIGTKMNHLLINLVDFGVAVSKGEFFLATLVQSRTLAIEKTLKALLPEMDDTTNEVN